MKQNEVKNLFLDSRFEAKRFLFSFVSLYIYGKNGKWETLGWSWLVVSCLPVQPRSSSHCRWSRRGWSRQCLRCTGWGRCCTRPVRPCPPPAPRTPGPAPWWSCWTCSLSSDHRSQQIVPEHMVIINYVWNYMYFNLTLYVDRRRSALDPDDDVVAQ